MPISRELKARIDALPYENLKAELLNHLNDPRRKRYVGHARATGGEYATDEEIFEGRVKSYMEVVAQRTEREARLYKWQEDEVIAFIQFLEKEAPIVYHAYLEQERTTCEIDAELWFRNLPTLAKQWHPGLERNDYRDLLSKVRDYAQAHLT